MRKEKHEAIQKLATELPQSLPTSTANAMQGHNIAAAPWNPSSKLPSISNPAGIIPSELKRKLQEGHTQQAEGVESAKAAMEDSILAELLETDEAAHKKSKKDVVSGPDTAEVSLQYYYLKNL